MANEQALRFSKLEALGNDFVLLDGRRAPLEINADLVRALAHRRLGVGCDQVLVLQPPGSPDHLLDVAIWNADGSPAEQCGNGMRAIGLWLNRQGEMDDRARINTPAGAVELALDQSGAVCATLTIPEFEESAWGLKHPGTGWQPPRHDSVLEWHGLALGNPHLVLEWPHRPTEAQLASQAALSRHPDLIRGANVGLAFVEAPDRIVLRVLERGAGPTPACGSGAAAAACALIRAGRVQPPVRVMQTGGECVIHWPGPGHPVSLTGPARHVFDGTLPWLTKP